jgi:hypothetical protein
LGSIAASYATCAACRDLGVADDPRRREYGLLARAVCPEKVRVLFIAESAPALNQRGRHSYFYLPEDDAGSQDQSSLFWAVAEVLELGKACGTDHAAAKSNPATWKTRLLTEFSSRRLWLLDSAKCAVNGLAEGRKRDSAVKRCADAWLRRELDLIEPEHVVLIKTNVFRELKPLLVGWGFGERILNDRAIPHPGSGHQLEFRDLLGAVVRAHPSLFKEVV